MVISYFMTIMIRNDKKYLEEDSQLTQMTVHNFTQNIIVSNCKHWAIPFNIGTPPPPY